MVLRQGTNTGYTIASDWVAACKGSGGGPRGARQGARRAVPPQRLPCDALARATRRPPHNARLQKSSFRGFFITKGFK